MTEPGDMLCLMKKSRTVSKLKAPSRVRHKPLVCCFEASEWSGVLASCRTSMSSSSALNIGEADREAVAGGGLLY